MPGNNVAWKRVDRAATARRTVGRRGTGSAQRADAVKISVVGTLNTEVILGPVERLPEWGRQVCVPEAERRHMGSAASVAVPLARLGIESVVVGTVGDDEAGRLVRDNLRGHGLSTDGVEVVPQAATGMCVSLVRSDGERLYVSSLGAVAALTEETLVRRMWPILSGSDLVLLTGLFALSGLGAGGATRCFARLKEKGITTALDTGWDSAGWPPATVEAVRSLLGQADLFLPNLDEARAIGHGTTLEQIARSLGEMGPREIAVKMGRDGGAVMAGGTLVRDPGFPRDVRNATAAGEAFNAGYLCGHCRGLLPAEALRLANATASLFLAGGSYPGLEEVQTLAGRPVEG